MKKLSALLAVVLSLCFSTGCFGIFGGDGDESGTILGISSSSPANAYYQIFMTIASKGDVAFEMNGIKYLALDLESVKFKEKTAVQTIFANCCEQKGWTLVTEDVASLVQRAKQGDIYFPDGLILSFSDESFSNSSIVTDVFLWHPNGGAVESKFAVSRSGRGWSAVSQ